MSNQYHENQEHAWQREMDYKLDTVSKLWTEIYELRSRINSYMIEINKLEDQVAQLRHDAYDAWMREP
jgi:peptidoglycan hydrolase CwlO-like protein